MNSRLKVAALIPAVVIILIAVAQLTACGTAPIEGQKTSTNPAADDYCRRNTESVLCSTLK